MTRTQRQRQRRVAAAIATTATISVGGVAVSLDTAAGDPLALPPVTTTTIPFTPIGPIPEVDLLATTTSTTAPSSSGSPTTTTSTSTTTTSTTVPRNTSGGTHTTVRQHTSSDPQPWTELGTATTRTGALPGVPAAVAGAAGVAALPAGPAALPEAVQPAPVAAAGLRSPVLLDHVEKASIALPVAGRSTKSILNVLFGLELPPATLAKVLAPFPVAGEATYSDDWHAPRFTPQPHDHEGTDLFAAKGTPVVASADGVVTVQRDSAVGGNTVRLTEPDGTYYYYAHLDRFAIGVESGRRVGKGDIIGFVGRTGNAEGGAPHLHFEIHPRGGEAVPPVPYLDRWLSEAMATASTLRAQPGAADSVVTLRPTRGQRGGSAVDALLRPASSERPLPDGTTLDPSSGLEISGVVLLLMWMFRRFRRRLASRQAG